MDILLEVLTEYLGQSYAADMGGPMSVSAALDLAGTGTETNHDASMSAVAGLGVAAAGANANGPDLALTVPSVTNGNWGLQRLDIRPRLEESK